MNLDKNLAQLDNSQLIRRADDPDLSYLFKHSLTQETAYNSLLVKKRREVHRRVAETIEGLYVDRLDEYAALLARHYAEAGDDEKTLEYATRAGDAAARVYANAEAISNYSLALSAATRLETVGHSSLEHLYLQRGRAFELSGKYPEALANYDEMEMSAHDRRDRALELTGVIARATLLSLGSVARDLGKAQRLCDQALGLAREIGDRKGEAKILWTLLLLNTYGTHHPREAVEYGEKSLALARELNLREQMAFTLNDLAYGYMQVGNLKRSSEAQVEARALWREVDNKPMLADNLALSAIPQLLMGNLDRAVASCEEAYAISHSIGNAWGVATSRMVEGFVVDQLARPSRATELFQEALDAGESAGAAGPVICARCGLGEVYGSLGAIERAIEITKPGLAYAEAHFDTWLEWVRAVLARLYLKQGDIRAAEASLGAREPQAPSASLALYVPPGAVTVLIAHVELALAKRDYDNGIAWLDDYIVYLRELGARIYVPQMLFLKGKAFLDRGGSEHAKEVLTQARDEAESLNHRPSLWLILGALSQIEAKRGEADESRRLRERALALVNEIAGYVDTPSLRESFLHTPAVLAIS